MIAVGFELDILDGRQPGFGAEILFEILDEMLFGISEAGLVFLVLFVSGQNLIQRGHVVFLHVQVSLLRNERFSLAKLGLCVLLLGKGFPDPLSCWVEVVDLPSVAAFSDCHGYNPFCFSYSSR